MQIRIFVVTPLLPSDAIAVKREASPASETLLGRPTFQHRGYRRRPEDRPEAERVSGPGPRLGGMSGLFDASPSSLPSLAPRPPTSPSAAAKRCSVRRRLTVRELKGPRSGRALSFWCLPCGSTWPANVEATGPNRHRNCFHPT